MEAKPTGIKPPSISTETIQKPTDVDQLGHQVQEAVNTQVKDMGHQPVTAETSSTHPPLLSAVTQLGGEFIGDTIGDTKDYIGAHVQEKTGQTTEIGVGARVVKGREGLEVAQGRANKISQFPPQKKAA